MFLRLGQVTEMPPPLTALTPVNILKFFIYFFMVFIAHVVIEVQSYMIYIKL
jgi:hypothetical protein